MDSPMSPGFGTYPHHAHSSPYSPGFNLGTPPESPGFGPAAREHNMQSPALDPPLLPAELSPALGCCVVAGVNRPGYPEMPNP
jgi:hypothetical protein